MKPLSIFAIIIAFAIGYGFSHLSLSPKLKIAQEMVVRAESDKQSLEQQMESLQSRLLSDAERRRIERERKELTSLRGEMTALRQKIDELEKARDLAAKQSSKQTVQADSEMEQEEVFEPSDYYAASLSVELDLGMTLVTGGWQTAPGRHTFMFMTPTRGSSDSGSDFLQFVSKVAEIDDSELAGFFLDNLKASGIETDNAGGFDGENANALFDGIKRSKSAKLLGLPTVVTSAGKEAVISTTFYMPVEGGSQARKLEMGVLPVFSEDDKLQLTLAATISSPDSEPVTDQ